MNGKKLGELLLHGDVLTKRQLNKAIAMQQAGDDRKLGEILVELGYIIVDDITDVMMQQASKAQAETEKSKRDLVLSQQILKSKTKAKPVIKQEPVMEKKPKELSEEQVLNTKFTLSVQTMIGAATGIASLVGMWYMLQADIQEAKELPSLESLYSEEYPSRPEGYNWPRSYEQYKDNVEGLQDEMDEAYGKIEELQEVIKELQQDIKSLERRKRDK
jgi:hypothetical protein